MKREEMAVPSWRYLVGQILAEGHHQHPGLAVPFFYFSSAGAEEDWTGEDFWFFDSAAVSLTFPETGCRVCFRHDPFLKATYLPGDQFFGKPMWVPSNERYEQKNSTWPAGTLLRSWAVSALSPWQGLPSITSFLLSCSSLCSQIVFSKTKIIVGAFSSFSLLGWITSVYCSFPGLSLLPSIWGQALWVGSSAQSGCGTACRGSTWEPRWWEKFSQNTQFPVKFLYYHYYNYYNY